MGSTSSDSSRLFNPRLKDVIEDRVDQEVRDGWLLEHRLTPAARADALRRVFLNGQPRWQSAFTTMLLFASIIAALGLSEDSAATIIGAMIVAPMGQPIIALGAAAAMGWFRQTVRMLSVISIGAVTVVATGYLMGLLLPNELPNDQILARCTPDLRDLGIALAAGGAGAYAYARDELSGVLPGVAIAVALVPPLVVVGMTLELGHGDLAAGAALSFVTNLVGIAGATAVVLLLTGFAPLPRLRSKSPAVLAPALLLLVGAIGVMIPLFHASIQVLHDAESAEARFRQAAKG